MAFKRVGGLSVVVAAVAVSVYAGQAPAPAPAKNNAATATLAQSILSEARKAIGGEDKLAAIKTLEIKGIARRGATDVNLEGDLTISVERPDKYLRKEAIILGNAAIDIVEGLNGSQAWQEQKFSGNMNFGNDDGGGNRGGGNRGNQPQQTAKVVSADELAKPTTLRMYLSDYRVVNGIKLPHLITRGSGDQVTEEWEIKSYKINPNLKADTFKK